MGQWLGLILFIAFILWQVVAQVAQYSAKKQQQERMREAAAQRRRQRPGEPPQPPPVRGGGQAASPQSRARIEDLAARRKAQLEELRRRRAQKGAAPQVRIGSQAGAPSRIKTVPVRARSSAPPRDRSDLRSLRAAEEAEKRRRQIEAEQQRQMGEARARQEEAEQRRKDAERRARRERARRKRKTVALTDVGDAYSLRRSGSGRKGRVNALLRHRTTLRDLLLLKEVLDPPRGLSPYDDPASH